MLISHEFDVSMAQMYKQKFDSRMRKAKHLAERIKLFIKDVETSKLKEADKKAILKILLGGNVNL